jgi:hypothetical protein
LIEPGYSSGGIQGSKTPPGTPPTQMKDIPSGPAVGRRVASGETRMYRPGMKSTVSLSISSEPLPEMQ